MQLVPQRGSEAAGLVHSSDARSRHRARRAQTRVRPPPRTKPSRLNMSTPTVKRVSAPIRVRVKMDAHSFLFFRWHKETNWNKLKRTSLVRETGRRIIPSHVASIRGVRHRLNEFLPRSFDAACPSDRWHDTADFKRAKNRDDHPCIACSLLRNGRAAW